MKFFTNLSAAFGREAFPNLTPKIVELALTASTVNTVYTCPAGKNAIVRPYIDHTSGSPSVFGVIKSGSETGKLRAAATLSSADVAKSLIADSSPMPILAAGEIFAVDMGTGAAKARLEIYEFDNTYVKPIRLYGVASGANTLYTCPTGKQALVMGQGHQANPLLDEHGVAAFAWSSTTDPSLTLAITHSDATTIPLTASTALAAGFNNLLWSIGFLVAGDVMTVTSDAAEDNLFIYGAVLEYNAP